MSKFSGKCDFADSIWMSAETDEEAFAKFNGTRLYVWQPLPDGVDLMKELKDGVNVPETYYKKVEYSSIKDLVPYYPHLVSMACYNNKTPRSSVVILSPESYIDSKERDNLEWYLKDLLKIYRRCKRKKVEFNVDDAVKEVCWNDYNKKEIIELANRVKERGKRASIDGIHLPFNEKYYRQELVNEMLKYGLDPCEYGDYERFIKEV